MPYVVLCYFMHQLGSLCNVHSVKLHALSSMLNFIDKSISKHLLLINFGLCWSLNQLCLLIFEHSNLESPDKWTETENWLQNWLWFWLCCFSLHILNFQLNWYHNITCLSVHIWFAHDLTKGKFTAFKLVFFCHFLQMSINGQAKYINKKILHKVIAQWNEYNSIQFLCFICIENMKSHIHTCIITVPTVPVRSVSATETEKQVYSINDVNRFWV